MTYTSSAFLGPDATPKAIQKLILTTCVIALFSALTEPVFTQIFGIPGLQTWLSLSWIGIHHYFIWQPLSYLFVQSNGSMGITLSFLIGLAFDMYILWIMGSAILDTVGTKPFLRLYFLSGIGAGLLALVAMYITKRYGILARYCRTGKTCECKNRLYRQYTKQVGDTPYGVRRQQFQLIKNRLGKMSLDKSAIREPWALKTPFLWN